MNTACNLCNQTFLNDSSLRRHRVRKHARATSAPSELTRVAPTTNAAPAAPRLFRCPNEGCEFSSAFRNSLRRHARLQHDLHLPRQRNGRRRLLNPPEVVFDENGDMHVTRAGRRADRERAKLRRSMMLAEAREAYVAPTVDDVERERQAQRVIQEIRDAETQAEIDRCLLLRYGTTELTNEEVFARMAAEEEANLTPLERWQNAALSATPLNAPSNVFYFEN